MNNSTLQHYTQKTITTVSREKVTVIASILCTIVTVALIILAAILSGYRIVAPSPHASGPSPDSSTKYVSTDSHESRVINLVKRANPAVVSIIISKDVPIVERYYQNVNPFPDFFGGGFGNFGFQIPQYREKGTEKKEVGGGSGFFVSSDGVVVTNRHVVSDPDATYTVITNDGTKYEAKVLVKDTVYDVAILKVKIINAPYLSFGNSDALQLGQTAIAIGNTLSEFRNSVSVGVVSGLSRSVIAGDMRGEREQLEGVIQTDAAINPGNSGGPLLDLNGNVIGVNVAATSGAENVGFALPANMVKNIVESVAKYGEVVRPYLGIRYVTITSEMAKQNDLPVDYGVLVQRGETAADLAVIPGSPADRAGIVENDIIIAVNGKSLQDSESLSGVIANKRVGDKITLTIYHRGDKKDVTVTLQKRKSNLE